MEQSIQDLINFFSINSNVKYKGIDIANFLQKELIKKVPKESKSDDDVMIVDWANELYEKDLMTNRLHNLLIDPRKFGGMTIQELTQKGFMKFRNCGMSSWEELVKLRGY
jgi:hypothetical protein